MHQERRICMYGYREDAEVTCSRFRVYEESEGQRAFQTSSAWF